MSVFLLIIAALWLLGGCAMDAYERHYYGD